MKDFLCYQLMGAFGVAAPLCSYVSITVNGELWGLYLAVEGVEDAFLRRNYGTDAGELYKPDSLSFGGDRGGSFDPEDLAGDAPLSALLPAAGRGELAAVLPAAGPLGRVLLSATGTATPAAWSTTTTSTRRTAGWP